MDFYQDHYDVILIGGGIASLGAGIPLAKAGLSVLMLEQHDLPGGVATSFVRDGYEYEAALHELMGIGPEETPYLLRQAFADWDIGIDWLRVPESYRLLAKSDGLDFVMPHGVQNAIDAIEKEVPGSRDSLSLFFSWCDKVWRSAIRVSSGEKIPGKEYLKDHFELIASSSYTVKQMMDHCKVPERAQKILSAYWVYLGAPMEILPFTPWAYMLSDYLEGGAYIPKHTTAEMALKMARAFQGYGGQIECGQKVAKILVEKRKAVGVRLSSGRVIRGAYIISNAYPNTVYTQMIEPANAVPKRALWNIAAKTVAASAFQVNLVLDEEPSFFGLHTYATFVSQGEMDGRAQFESMKGKEPWRYLAVTCMNFANPSAVPEGKTMLSLTACPFGNTLEGLKKEDYEAYKENMSRHLIEAVQGELGCEMKGHIESIVSFSPVTIARYTGAYNGSMYGYLHSFPDGMVARTLQEKKERFFRHLYFVGAHAPQGDGMACVIYSGMDVARKVLDAKRRGK